MSVTKQMLSEAWHASPVLCSDTYRLLSKGLFTRLVNKANVTVKVAGMQASYSSKTPGPK